MPAVPYATVAAAVLAFLLAALVVRIAHAVVHRLLGGLESSVPRTGRLFTHARNS